MIGNINFTIAFNLIFIYYFPTLYAHLAYHLVLTIFTSCLILILVSILELI